MTSRGWSAAEIERLVAVMQAGGKPCAAFPDRTPGAVYAQVWALRKKGRVPQPSAAKELPRRRFDSHALLYRLHDGLKRRRSA